MLRWGFALPESPRSGAHGVWSCHPLWSEAVPWAQGQPPAGPPGRSYGELQPWAGLGGARVRPRCEARQAGARGPRNRRGASGVGRQIRVPVTLQQGRSQRRNSDLCEHPRRKPPLKPCPCQTMQSPRPPFVSGSPEPPGAGSRSEIVHRPLKWNLGLQQPPWHGAPIPAGSYGRSYRDFSSSLEPGLGAGVGLGPLAPYGRPLQPRHPFRLEKRLTRV